MLKRSSLQRKEFKQEELALMKKLDLNDIEIICINDGSTDSSLEILKKYEKKYNF